MMVAYVFIVGALLAGLIVVSLGHSHAYNFVPIPRLRTIKDVQQETSAVLIDSIDPERIKANLRALTQSPHQAGTKSNRKVTRIIENLYIEAGLSHVHTTTYDVLLSYPDWKKPNKLRIRDRSGRLVFESRGVSPPLNQDEQGTPDAGHQWLAYSAAGVVTGDVVYCNFGTLKDFENMKKMGVEVKGKIAMLRYGEGYRGDKVRLAEQMGAVAAILFSDPDDVAREGLNKVYPNSVWMPAEGVQRGSIMTGNGDPLSPLYPSKPGAFKSRTIQEAKSAGKLRTIPAIPVSYSTAHEILSRMRGRPVPLAWQGGLNVTYRMGPGMQDQQEVTVDVKSTLVQKHIHNVIGYLPGVDEEDQYVILGNHYDAWVYGSLDPNSGTAILAEVARALVHVSKTTSWKPSRSIMFAAWDAEEYGLIGSTEFVEEFVQQLSDRAVVYLNMDCLHGNHSLHVLSVPTLYDVVVSTAKRIPNPVQSEIRKGRKTLYDTWVRTFPGDSESMLPDMPAPHGGSDHAPFLNYVGVPVVDFSFNNATTRDTYPLYHTLYETPFVNEHLYDHANFSIHQATGQFWAELGRTFADATVLPLNASRLAEQLASNYLPGLRKEMNKLLPVEELTPARNSLDNLEHSVQNFLEATKRFVAYEADTKEHLQTNPFDLRHLKGVNERLMMVERCFVNPRGMADQPSNRHILFSVSELNQYSGVVMSAVYDAIEAFKVSRDQESAGRELAQQISIVYHAVNCAVAALRHFI